MKEIHELDEGSMYFGTLPKGCTYCGPGEKLVLLITGKCQRRCFYCPLSIKKRGKDVIYADELKVDNLEDILEEANAIAAKGTGITGGDPMVTPELTLEAIRLLKDNFGDKHHIHLYTAGGFELKYIAALSDAGLDELRFHPPAYTWDKVDKHFDNLLKLALDSKISIGAELPVIPGFEESIKSFTQYIDSCGVEFINLNELEFSEGNWDKCKARGFSQKSPISNAVLGSERSAIKILHELANDDELTLNIHYCSAQFKDRQQLRNRLIRRAKHVIRPFELLTEDGTFLLGIIEPINEKNLNDLERVRTQFLEKFDVPGELLNLSYKAKRLEIASWILEKLRNEIPAELREHCFIIEEYPTADRLEVERIPIDEFK